MSRPDSLTDNQKRRLRRLKFARRELIRQLKALPSAADLSRDWNVSERTIRRWMLDCAESTGPQLTTIRDLYST